MLYSAEKIKKAAIEAEKVNKSLVKDFKRRPPRNLDNMVHEAHYKVFEKIDCLDCGNCCRTLGPRITDKDIVRLAAFFKVRSGVFTENYLRKDEDGDFVFKNMPCPFLETHNKCSVYENRPKACRDYPHTDRKKFHQLLELSLKNSYVCPAVLDIFSILGKQKVG